MTENEFNELADAVFARIERTLDRGDLDLEYTLDSGVMEIEFADDSKIVINRHAPNREIWVAARSGGFHYAWDQGQWASRRDGSELFGKLAELIASGCGATPVF